MEKSRSVSTILVFFGLNPAPPSFRHARPRVRRPSGLDSSVLGPVSNFVVPDLFRKSARQEKRRNATDGTVSLQSTDCANLGVLSARGGADRAVWRGTVCYLLGNTWRVRDYLD